jgi:hypothetical protein
VLAGSIGRAIRGRPDCGEADADGVAGAALESLGAGGLTAAGVVGPHAASIKIAAMVAHLLCRLLLEEAAGAATIQGR